MTQANQADFFGEGLANPAQAPTDPDDLPNPANPGGISNNELRRRQQALARDSGLNHAQGPVNTAPSMVPNQAASQGLADIYLGATRAPGTPGSSGTDSHGRPYVITGGVPPGFSSVADYNAHLGTVTPGITPGGTPTYGSPGTQTLSFTPPGAPTGSGGAGAPSDALSSTADNSMFQGQQMANQASQAQPTVPADKQVNTANRDALTPVIDPMLERNQEVDRAFAMSQDLYNRIMNAPSQTGLVGDQVLSAQLAAARSARGGPGAVQEALGEAQRQAPELQRQGAQSAIAEQQQRFQNAQGALGIYSAVAGNVADRATAIATANQNAGLHVLDNLTTLTGQEMQFDAQQMAVIGQLARDFMNNAAQFANMSVQLQIAQWEDITRRYGIDKVFDAQVRQIASNENIGPLDALKMILGGASALPGVAGLF